MADVRFVPVVGTEQQIKAEKQTDGQVYFATDTHKIYLDTEKDNKLPMGGAGNSGIYYGTKELTDEEKELEEIQFTLLNDIEGEELPSQDDLVLNADGCFYRVIFVDIKNKIVTGSRLTVAGSGGGGGAPTVIRPSLTVHEIPNSVIVNGQPFSFQFTAKSALDENNTPFANKLKIYWSLIDADTKQVYYNGLPKEVNHDEISTLNIGAYLKESTTTTIELYAEGLNHDQISVIRQASVTTVEMYLEQTNYNPATTYNEGEAILNCNAIGNLSKILEWTVDGKVVGEEVLLPNSLNPRTFKIPNDLSKHGYHAIEVNLYQNLGDDQNPIKGLAAEPLKYEIAIVNRNDKTKPPVIWLGDYKEQYYNYETIQIPFLVFDVNNGSEVEVHLYKNDIEIDSSPRTIKDFSKFSYWQIADADEEKENYYSISCGLTPETSTVREIKFRVTEDKSRPMKIVQTDYLELNFDPIGRTNSESVAKRQSWSYGEGENKKSAIFENFNWYNNGWYTDTESKSTFLRVSNGAKFTIPFRKLTFGTSDYSARSNSIEIAFKVRNIQNYANLITNITRYNIPVLDSDGKVTSYIKDDDKYNAFLNNKDGFTNYDAYLQATLEDPRVYDNLQFNTVQKNINLKNVVCGFYSGTNNSAVGMCVGTQDAFFSNGVETVNVNFVENEMIYLSFVYDYELKLLLIYINGAITGVIKSSLEQDQAFTINTENIVFNSEICDIDLYKLRIYKTNLSVNDIVTNHAVDKKDILIYDQNGLAMLNNILKEYQLNFDKVLDYNKEHPEEPLMPYIIFDTTADSKLEDKLPYAKANGTSNIRVEFVNAPLDAAYARGELVQRCIDDYLLTEGETNQDIIDKAVKTYYEHNCPSWTSTLSAKDVVTIEVQGTSSEFYPRRNFKIKTKSKTPNTWGDLEDDDGNKTGEQGWTEDECLNIYMHKGPYEDIYALDKTRLQEDEHYLGMEESRMNDGWYMNNYTNPTDRWTMKVDYMESSGSYNAGFASMTGRAYTKHPLEDYVKAGVLTKTEELESDVFKELRWQDYRTSLLGFPVMAFQKRYKRKYSENSDKVWTSTVIEPKQTETIFIGYYRMLLDKGSDQVLGFKPSKKIEHKLVDNKKLRDVAECWEFATNARTFCSYKDPWNRVELSFKSPTDVTDGFIKLPSGETGGPVVLNHFEPRYFEFEDYLKNDENGFYNFGALNPDFINEMCDEIGIPRIDKSADDAKYKAQEGVSYLMRNWEKVCKWIYSTNLDNVKSQGTYTEAVVGKELYDPIKNEYYILDQQSETGYSRYTGEFQSGQTYFKIVEYKVEEEKFDSEGNKILDENGDPVKETVIRFSYVNAYATTSDLVYKPNVFYVLTNGAYSICSDEEFDSAITYYTFESLEDKDIEKIADLLVAPATLYDANTDYYIYNDQARVPVGGGKTTAVNYIGKVSQEDFENNNYYVKAPKTYGNITYNYDTKEYRTSKFINELPNHFDLEYLATFFILTEVFECYDSRGKNCMMASWGPLKEGGDYIWYPIFYDIDTQLGINNTGIPSFEFNVDATEAGNYSTSDSVLWNNFYKFFKGSQILDKYKNLRGQQSNNLEPLEAPPLKDVNNIEKWYMFDPNITNNVANKGKRPLIATNLDMYWKYITITNGVAPSQGVAYIPGADGEYGVDDGTYFYALQGDRSQSRRQFLTNRLEYIDSWLNQGNYGRGGNHRIRGRISANNISGDTTSDNYVEGNGENYWVDGKEFGTKTHDFDSEYWLTLTPVRSSYVTAGDDSANYPSKKYDGINPVKFKLSDIETGIRQSSNYPEQLVYIYGMNQMSDFGEMNKMYWTEFYMEGRAEHLTRLQLGYDGYSRTDANMQWYNKKLNGITLATMPLLKEANFSRIGLLNETTLDLTASEKLENFRAVGTSKLINVKFADGVALNTLYLPASIASLKLVQANLLTNLIESNIAPTPINNDDGTVSPPTQGLFLEGFFGENEDDNNFTSSINSIYLDGGALGYGSYKILKRFYNIIEARENNSLLNRITMTDVNWSPYQLLTEGVEYNKDEANYYIDDNHYGLISWKGDPQKIAESKEEFNKLVLNGKLYLYTGSKFEHDIDHNFIQMLLDLNSKDGVYIDASSSQSRPIVSGIVYIDNDSNNAFEESYIRNTLQPMYPNLKFIFKNVTKAYSAEFLYRNPETGADEYVRFKNGSKEPSVQKISQEDYTDGIWFESPFDLYDPQRTHYDFKGWSMNPNAVPNTSEVITKEVWDTLKIDKDEFDYIYYAIFEIHSYDIVFHDGDGSELETVKAPYGSESTPLPNKVPYKDDSQLDELSTYSIIGYTDNILTNKLVDLSTTMVRSNVHYYPVFKEINVYDNFYYINNMSNYFSFTDGQYNDPYTNNVPDWVKTSGSYLSLANKNIVLRGKITLPSVTEDGTPIIGISNDTFSEQSEITHIFFQNKLKPEDNQGTLRNELRQIGSKAFYNCFKLKIFEWPDRLRRINTNAFHGCYSLESTTLGKSLIALGENAFKHAFAPDAAGEVNIILPSTFRGFFGIDVFGGFSNCNYFFHVPNKIIGKLQFGENETNKLEFLPTYLGNIFTATTVNEIIVYCSDEHYNSGWNTPSYRQNLANENSDTIFTFPCQPEGNYID